MDLESSFVYSQEYKIQVRKFSDGDLSSEYALVIIDRFIYERFKSYLFSFDSIRNTDYIIVDCGERHKTLKTVEYFLGEFTNRKINREQKVLVIGGGALSDVAGMSASIYMRGITWHVMPTTLLAQVDAGAGGKVGVNFYNYKNFIGAFHHPELILCDTYFLSSLEEQQFKNGLGEVFKYAVGCDAGLFLWLEENYRFILQRVPSVMNSLVSKCLTIKANIVQMDPADRLGVRKTLNLGHTFAHAIEVNSNFSIQHGIAVAIGIMLACKLANTRGLLSKSKYERILKLSRALELDFTYTFTDVGKMYDIMLLDKKNDQYGQVIILLPNDIGSVSGRERLSLNELEALRLSYAECQ